MNLISNHRTNANFFVLSRCYCILYSLPPWHDTLYITRSTFSCNKTVKNFVVYFIATTTLLKIFEIKEILIILKLKLSFEKNTSKKNAVNLPRKWLFRKTCTLWFGIQSAYKLFSREALLIE